MAEVTSNAVSKGGNGLGPRTRIINLAKTNMTQVELDAALTYLSAGDVAGTNDAHSIAGVSVLTESGVFTGGTTDAVQVAIQGTGAATMASNFGTGSTGITATLVAEFID
ncbi:MAG: hypothetical protein ACKVJK_07050 [Methylophagaceae bacterium]|jgi:hypothetical protein|tara:strand:+ start:2096 stop:2425 length:330 start_codon:yes stop_codon:yes gene_type:complete